MLHVVPLGRLFDVRLGVDVSGIALFLVTVWSISGGFGDVPRTAAIGLAAGCTLLLFASIVAHEFAHALTARRFGVRTQSINLFIFGGVATLENEPPTPRAELWIALAGPAMSGVLALLALGSLAVIAHPSDGIVARALARMIAYVVITNAALAIFNTIPAFPMDGGRVLRAALWKLHGNRAAAGCAASIVSVFLAAALIAASVAAAVAQHRWFYCWPAAIGAFLIRQGWLQWRAARAAERLEQIAVVAFTEAGSAECVAADLGLAHSSR